MWGRKFCGKEVPPIPHSPFRTHFPSSQSTYSTEPRRNLNGTLDFIPQSCSSLQKNGSCSADHRGRKTSGRGAGVQLLDPDSFGIQLSGSWVLAFPKAIGGKFLAKTAALSWAKFFPSENPQACAASAAGRVSKSSRSNVCFIIRTKLRFVFGWPET